MRRLICLLLVSLLCLATGCDEVEGRQRASALTGGGDPLRGREAIRHHGCSSCHTIPGVRGADSLVGPSLQRIGSRAFIGGVLPNNPDNLVQWIIDPPGVDPQTAMPNLRVPEADARDIASYLYTLN